MQNDVLFFHGALSNKTDVLARAFCFNKYYTERNRAFRKKIEKIDLMKTAKEKVKALRQISDNKDFIKYANSSQLMLLYRSFRDLGCFKDMVGLYHKVDNLDFKRAQTVREMLGVAYNKVKQPEKAIETVQELYVEGAVSGEGYRILGRAALIQSDRANNPDEKKAFLKESAAYYEHGFNEFFEFYPGIQAVHRNIELGNIDKAAKMAKLVSMACKRDGAKETKDFYCMSARLEAACIMNKKKDIDKTFNQIRRSGMPRWLLKDTIDSLERVNKYFKSDETTQVTSSLRMLMEGKEPPFSREETTQQENVLSAIHKNSYSYRGAGSNFAGAMTIEGNFRYGGQLPAHSVSRKDLEFFNAVLACKMEDLFPEKELPAGFLKNVSFDQIKNPDVFLQMTDKFIRYHFGTNNFLDTGLHLEDNAGIQNSTYDQCVDALINCSGKQRTPEDDSKTNISAMFALGLGDCRHHAQVKQIMFDCWQHKKLNNALAMATKALDSSDTKAYDDAVDHFYSIYNFELRTIDVKVNAPVKMQKTYTPVKTQDGKFIEDHAAAMEMEEHSLSVLLQRNRAGVLQKVGLRDAFYQNHYSWEHADIDISKIEVSGGKFKIPAGEIPADKVNTGKALPILLSPTAYAGKRDTAARDCTGEDVRLLGIPVKSLKTPYDFFELLHQRDKTKQELRNILVYQKEKQERRAAYKQQAQEKAENHSVVSGNPDNVRKILSSLVITRQAR